MVLSTTEREFFRESKYDKVAANGYITKGSLHYLDANNRKLITYRRLSLYHEPQIFKGLCLTSELDKVKVSPQTGEFVHDGEHERLQKFQQQQDLLYKPQPSNWKSFTPKKYPTFENIELESENLENSDSIEIPSSANVTYQHQNPVANTYFDYSQSKSGVCVFCGKVTYDWWWHNGKTGECKCRACLKEGKS